MNSGEISSIKCLSVNLPRLSPSTFHVIEVSFNDEDDVESRVNASTDLVDLSDPSSLTDLEQ
jgi:hypothetical protein